MVERRRLFGGQVDLDVINQTHVQWFMLSCEAQISLCQRRRPKALLASARAHPFLTFFANSTHSRLAQAVEA